MSYIGVRTDFAVFIINSKELKIAFKNRLRETGNNVWRLAQVMGIDSKKVTLWLHYNTTNFNITDLPAENIILTAINSVGIFIRYNVTRYIIMILPIDFCTIDFNLSAHAKFYAKNPA